MRVNIIVGAGDLDWIGGRLARELAQRLPDHSVEATINGGPGDLEYQQIVYGEPLRRPAVGVFTHGSERPKQFGASYGGQVALNSATLGYLIDAVGAEGPALIELPVDDRFIKRPIIFGVSGRVYGDGRKGEHLVAEMVRAGYHVVAWGHGWPCLIVSSSISDLLAFYRGLDYYVDTSSDEGGCVPALECMALGIPVISHTLGVDRPVLSYKIQDWPSLNAVLHRLTHPRTYDDWAREHAAYFKTVLERSNAA